MSEIRVCPDCGSALVEFSALAGGAGKCKACPWQGKNDDLLTIPVGDGISEEQTLLAMRNDLRKLISLNARGFLEFLTKWGFIAAHIEKDKLVITNEREPLRYISAIAQGIFVSIVEERKKLEVERGRRS